MQDRSSCLAAAVSVLDLLWPAWLITGVGKKRTRFGL